MLSLWQIRQIYTHRVYSVIHMFILNLQIAIRDTEYVNIEKLLLDLII